MGLDAEDRGELEHLIDASIEDVQTFVDMGTSDKLKNRVPIKDETAFVLGIIWGTILTMFSLYYKSKHKKGIAGEDEEEGDEIILRRTAEIKDAIENVFNSFS